jgi:hypothetical protein
MSSVAAILLAAPMLMKAFAKQAAEGEGEEASPEEGEMPGEPGGVSTLPAEPPPGAEDEGDEGMEDPEESVEGWSHGHRTGRAGSLFSGPGWY